MKRRTVILPEKIEPRIAPAPARAPRSRLSLRYGGERPAATDTKDGDE